MLVKGGTDIDIFLLARLGQVWHDICWLRGEERATDWKMGERERKGGSKSEERIGNGREWARFHILLNMTSTRYNIKLQYDLILYHIPLTLCHWSSWHTLEQSLDVIFRSIGVFGCNTVHCCHGFQFCLLHRADPRFAPSQLEKALLCNDVSLWLGASLESALCYICLRQRIYVCF